MVAVGEILLNAFLEVLFERLASRNLLRFVRQLQGGVDSELKKWEKKLKMIQAVLCDAEEKQLTDEAVKMWLDELQDLAYDAEDILDEFATQALESKLMAQNQDSSGQVLSLIPASLNPNAIMFNYSMGSKIKDMTSRLEQLCQERIELGLQRLTSLTHLEIIGCDDEAECFPDEEIGMTLPTSLTHLQLSEFKKLKSLSSTGLQSLNSLQSLWILGCPNLTSFPEVGLPSSLLELHIVKCPKLKEVCKRDQGEEWSKIAHIPCIEIDWKFIYDPESEG